MSHQHGKWVWSFLSLIPIYQISFKNICSVQSGSLFKEKGEKVTIFSFNKFTLRKAFLLHLCLLYKWLRLFETGNRR